MILENVKCCMGETIPLCKCCNKLPIFHLSCSFCFSLICTTCFESKILNEQVCPYCMKKLSYVETKNNTSNQINKIIFLSCNEKLQHIDKFNSNLKLLNEYSKKVNALSKEVNQILEQHEDVEINIKLFNLGKVIILTKFLKTK